MYGLQSNTVFRTPNKIRLAQYDLLEQNVKSFNLHMYLRGRCSSPWIWRRLCRFRGFRSVIRLSGRIITFHRFFRWCHMCLEAFKIQGLSVRPGNASNAWEKISFIREQQVYLNQSERHTWSNSIFGSAKTYGYWYIGSQRVQIM